MLRSSNFHYIKLFNKVITFYLGQLGIFISITEISNNCQDDWREQGLLDCLFKLTRREKRVYCRYCMLINKCQKLIENLDLPEDGNICNGCKMKCKCSNCKN